MLLNQDWKSFYKIIIVTGFPVETESWELIGNATTHNAHYIGQIAYLRKMK